MKSENERFMDEAVHGRTPTRAMEKFTQAYELILSGIYSLGYDVDKDQNFAGTPARAAKGLMQMIIDQRSLERVLEDVKRATFTVPHDDLIATYDIRASGVCPHHILPVMYSFSVGYVPKKEESRIVGLSKIPRLVKALSKRPVCQEALVNVICDHLHGDKSLIPTAGCMVTCRAIHTCMRCRGVEDQTAVVVSSAIRGIFDPRESSNGVREEFLRMAERYQWP